jgi:glycosyltransferase A (GT-A) superfamily protein (DUF2064 family)
MNADRLSELGDVAGELVNRLKTSDQWTIKQYVELVRRAMDKAEINEDYAFVISELLDTIVCVIGWGMSGDTRLALVRVAATIETLIEDIEQGNVV